ncbi:AraC family transcriptional regulator [Bacillus sp. SD088]|uniref:AraC family transcriptional regulator n=1 Tax=Bacillus sp. SD088 TaxID=2782012 RepID=UPI001A97C7F0|nr:AraC family transcriptional regulator [Bacillus sp. SD088]MBO0995643.1 helix-turn-helix transcriptional regulator [Bacillus sp. SD088]
MDFSDVLCVKRENVHFHWCGYLQANGPWKHEERINSDFELMIVTEGVLQLVVEDKKIELYPGNMLLLPPNTYFVGGGAATNLGFYWVHFEATKLESSISNHSRLLKLPVFSKELLLDNELLLIQQMQTIKQMDFPTSDLIDAYLHTLLLGISEKFQQPLYLKTDRHYLIDYIKNYIQWNYQRMISVEEIANYFGYNKAYVSYLFSRESGETITQYINNIRLEAARQSLLTTNDSIQRIANKNGFEDEKYFSRIFSKKYQHSPRAYRKRYGRIEKM